MKPGNFLVKLKKQTNFVKLNIQVIKTTILLCSYVTYLNTSSPPPPKKRQEKILPMINSVDIFNRATLKCLVLLNPSKSAFKRKTVFEKDYCFIDEMNNSHTWKDLFTGWCQKVPGFPLVDISLVNLILRPPIEVKISGAQDFLSHLPFWEACIHQGGNPSSLSKVQFEPRPGWWKNCSWQMMDVP